MNQMGASSSQQHVPISDFGVTSESSCGEQQPDASNSCNGMGDTVDLGGFCTLAGPAGESYRITWCEKKGSVGEWGLDPNGEGSTCTYNDCTKYTRMADPVCCIGASGCCSIVGTGALCKRAAFNGDPVQCCLNDNACSSDSNSCWSDGASQRKTCDPSVRNVTSSTCQDNLLTYCSGADLTDPNDSSWINRWIDPTGKPLPRGCYYALQRNIYSTQQSPCNIPPLPITTCTAAQGPFSASGLAWAQQLLQRTLVKYSINGFTIGSLPGTSGYSPFQDFLYNNVCCPYPVLCQEGLNSVCARYTTQRLALNPTAITWCGCHLPAGEYSKYVNNYQINKECTPMCNKAGVIPLTDANNIPIACNQGICLIDNVTINLLQSSVTGGINISQVCANCQSSGSCSCIIENSSFTAANSSLGTNIDLSQTCTSSICTRTGTDADGKPASVNVPCDASSDYNPLAAQEAALREAKRRRDIEMIAIILIVIIILAVALLIISPWIKR